MASTSAVPSRRHCGVRRARPRRGCRRTPAHRAGDRAGSVRALDEDLVRQQRARADARLLERDEARACASPDFAMRVGVGRARAAGRSPPATSARARPPCRRRAATQRWRDDERAPSASTRGSPCRRCAGAASRAAARACASTTGSSVIATSTRDERDQHAAVAHRAQERQRQRDQREQADRDGGAAEHDGAAGGLHRPLDRLVAAAAVRALLAPARRPRSASSRSPRRARSARSGTARSARSSVTCVSPSSSRNVVMIDAIAITIGTTARNDANTNAEHGERAERRPAAPPAARPGPPESSPLSLARASKPVRCTGCAGRPSRPCSAALAAFSAFGFSPNGRVGVGRAGRRPRTPCARPWRGTSCRRSSAYDGEPRAGQRPLELLVDLAQVGLHRRRVDASCPAGSVTTGTSGAVSPPVPW